MNEKMPPLTPKEKKIIIDKGTEPPFSGRYWNQDAPGVYQCRRCGRRLFESGQKFESTCGWPSFDAALPGTVRETPDADGRRTEIVCDQCGGHLGHVFRGEGFTAKNTRFCVNSASLAFEPENGSETAVFAGGCFWGVEAFFHTVPGVLEAVSGYTGGEYACPTYEEVCAGRTGHAEAVRVVFDPALVSYEILARMFFEIHDPAQLNRQGPDVGTQYRSAIFCADEKQKETAEKLIAELQGRGWPVATVLEPLGPFYPAEDHHQDYFKKHGRGLCHSRVSRFDIFYE